MEREGRKSKKETDRQTDRHSEEERGRKGRETERWRGGGGERGKEDIHRERVFNAINSAKIRNRNAQHNNVFTCFRNAVKDRLHLISAPLNLLWCENPSLILTIATCCHVVFNTMGEACVGKEFTTLTLIRILWQRG